MSAFFRQGVSHFALLSKNHNKLLIVGMIKLPVSCFDEIKQINILCNKAEVEFNFSL